VCLCRNHVLTDDVTPMNIRTKHNMVVLRQRVIFPARRAVLLLTLCTENKLFFACTLTVSCSMHSVPCETDHHSAAAICMLRMPLNTNHPLINSRDWLTNRLPYNLYCVGGDVKHCSLTHDWQILLTDLLVWHVYWAIWKPYSLCCLTLWRPVVPHGYSYKAYYARPG